MDTRRVLWISQKPLPTIREAVRAGLEITVESQPAAAFARTRASDPDVVIVSLPLANWDGVTAVEYGRRIRPEVPILVQSAEDEIALRRAGAAGVIDPEAGWASIEAELERLARGAPGASGDAAALAEPWRGMLVGRSPRMQDVAEFVRLVGPRKCTALITGETGTGKEVVARALHLAGPRAARPMVSFCCTAVPEHLVEAELFGHERGAFTGAVARRTGKFEQAHGSTLFLDEIGDMPLEVQAKLLRVLQERELQRLGGCETIRVDLRIIAATNADLEAKVESGQFREDLYYRIAVAKLRLPPLRDRFGDIPELARHFVRKACEGEGLPLKRMEDECMRRLSAYAWPGNVRQLENAIEAAVAFSGEREVLLTRDFPALVSLAPVPGEPLTEISLPEGGIDFDSVVTRVERSMLAQALLRTGGNKKMAADLLGLKRTTLAAKLRSLGGGVESARVSSTAVN